MSDWWRVIAADEVIAHAREHAMTHQTGDDHRRRRDDENITSEPLFRDQPDYTANLSKPDFGTILSLSAFAAVEEWMDATDEERALIEARDARRAIEHRKLMEADHWRCD